jgi:hypothetical protein
MKGGMVVCGQLLVKDYELQGLLSLMYFKFDFNFKVQSFAGSRS